MAGLLSFPTFGGEEKVRVQLYRADFNYGGADFELSQADMESALGALPTWSFHPEDLPVGTYQVRLSPFMASWMIELPVGGAPEVELVLPELAEVLVGSVDAWTDERIPLGTVGYGSLMELPGQVSNLDAIAASEDEPGLFRFWTVPGPACVRTYRIPSALDYGARREHLELVPGLQSVRFELAPACAIHFEFLVDEFLVDGFLVDGAP